MKKKITVTLTLSQVLDEPDEKCMNEVIVRQLRNAGAEDDGVKLTLTTICDKTLFRNRLHYKPNDNGLYEKEFTFDSIPEFLQKYTNYICHYDTIMCLRDYFHFEKIQCSEEEIKEEPETTENKTEE